jgi:RNA polymerase sigma-70 factor (family 1)
MGVFKEAVSVKNATTEARQANQAAPADLDQLYRRVVLENDYRGFELIYKQYYSILCNYALRFVANKEAARDVVSEVFYRFWKNRSAIDVKTSCRAYLFTAVKHQAYNYLTRDCKKDLSLEQQCGALSAEAYNPEELLVFEELHRKVEAAIDSLTPQCKTVFVLSRSEGLKYSEIAERLQITQKAVEAHISRALKQLRPLVRIVVLVMAAAGVGLSGW